MIKSLKLLVICMGVLLVFSGLPKSALANTDRLSGNDRYQTARAIAERVAPGITQNVIITTGNGFADALSSSVLAAKLNAPILLVDSTASKSTEAFDYIGNHLDKNGTVYIIGGTGLIGPDFISKLNQMGYYNVKQIGGRDRYETDSLIAQELNVPTSTTVVVASGENYPDALSISSIAAHNGWPILLVSQNKIPDSIKATLNSIKPSKIYIVGGTGVVSDGIQSQFQPLLPGVQSERLAGSDRFETGMKIIEKFAQSPQTLYLATGFGFADALAGSALGSKTGDPIVLVNQDWINIPAQLTSYLSSLHSSNINPDIVSFGGTGVVSELVVSKIASVLMGANVTYSFANPAPFNTSQTIHVQNIFDDYTAQMSVEQIIRGNQAWQMISSANMFNSPPKDGYEYILAKVNFSLLDIPSGESFNLNGAVDIDAVSEQGTVYDFVSVVCPDPEIDAELYKGATVKGWAAFMVRKDDLRPRLAFGRKYDGTGGIWFKAY
jgi:putative cell wall-binding protein